jgi:hypothetical protein
LPDQAYGDQCARHNRTRKKLLTSIRSEYSATVNLLVVILIGALLGGLSGAGIFFVMWAIKTP